MSSCLSTKSTDQLFCTTYLNLCSNSDFVDVLKSFLFVLKHAGAGIWEGEGPEFPQVVFDAVKDNPSYTTMISTSDPATDRPWYIYWLPTFLLTLVDLPIYGDVLAKVADFMCEELQHERFRDVRPMVMVAVTRVGRLRSLFCTRIELMDYPGMLSYCLRFSARLQRQALRTKEEPLIAFLEFTPRSSFLWLLGAVITNPFGKSPEWQLAS